MYNLFFVEQFAEYSHRFEPQKMTHLVMSTWNKYRIIHFEHFHDFMCKKTHFS